jgi:hypothetical protein
VASQASPLQPDERLPGSTEVLESCFGKLKVIEKDQARNGFTAMVLSLAAMVWKTTAAVVHRALETCSIQMVKEWIEDNLGKTVQAQRRQALPKPRLTAKQKRGETTSTERSGFHQPRVNLLQTGNPGPDTHGHETVRISRDFAYRRRQVSTDERRLSTSGRGRLPPLDHHLAPMRSVTRLAANGRPPIPRTRPAQFVGHPVRFHGQSRRVAVNQGGIAARSAATLHRLCLTQNLLSPTIRAPRGGAEFKQCPHDCWAE